MTERVAVVGGGPAGLTAAIYTARAGLDTTVFDADESILARNAHLENYPGFPAGVNARTFLEATREQAKRTGVAFVEAHIEHVDRDAGTFRVRADDIRESHSSEPHSSESDTQEQDSREFDFVVAASWPDVSYLDEFDLERVQRGSKTMLPVDEFARTSVDGVYAAGRIGAQHHQAVVAAGHGATAGLAVIEDSDVPYYHDWVAPEGYFSGRGREIPPGCEEIDEEERVARERESLDAIHEFSEANRPTNHPRAETDE